MIVTDNNSTANAYNFGFLDEYAKKEIRRAILKAIAIPGYQVPYASREMPMGRGFGTGGLQLTLSLIGPDEVVKVIDQGSDDSVNAVNLRQFIEMTCPGISTTTKTDESSLIQSRHRIPERPLTSQQIIVLQVPYPDPLVVVEPSEDKRKTMHGLLFATPGQTLRGHRRLRRNHHFAPLPDTHQRSLRHRPFADSAMGRAETQRFGGLDSVRRRSRKEDLRCSTAHPGRTASVLRRPFPCRGFLRCSRSPPRLHTLRVRRFLSR